VSIASCGASKDGGLKPISVTVPVTRQVTGLGNTKIWELIKEGKLRTVRVGGRVLVIYRSIEELLGIASSTEDEAE
jgi:excisionase family DNA binding protein